MAGADVAGNLASIRDRVEVMLQDTGNATWVAGDIDEAIQEALERYTKINPAREIDTVTLAADGREIDISAITAYLSIERVWWDYDAADPRHPPRWRDFEVWPGDIVYINDAGEPQTNDVVRLWLTKKQTIDDLDGATASTLPADDVTLIVTGAAGIAAVMRSREVGELLGIDGWVPRRARDWGEARIAEFEAGLSKMAAQIASRASGIAGVRVLDRWEADGSGWW